MSDHKTPQALTAQELSTFHGQVPAEELLRYVTDAFDALGDPTRARIVYALTRRSLNVRDIASVVGISESGVSHQLRILRDRRVVKSQRHGNAIYYSVDDPHIGAMIREAEYHADHAFRGLPDHPYPQSRHREA